MESKRYRLRVLDLWPCDEERPLADPGAAAANDDRPKGDGAAKNVSASAGARKDSGNFRLGVTVEIEATDEKNTSPVFTSPRAATLEKNGKIFRPSIDPSPTPACQALLEPRSLAFGESTRGTLVFEAPAMGYFRSAEFRFRPPRWGRDSRLGVRLPDCFGNGCPSRKNPSRRSLERAPATP